jgi:hypothetical protein
VLRAIACTLLALGCGAATQATPSTVVRDEPRVEAAVPARVAPEASRTIEIAEPAPGTRRTPLATSTMRLGIRVPLAAIAGAANESTPALLAEESWGVAWAPVRAGYRATRGPIELRGDGADVEWSVPVHLSGRADPVGACEAQLTARVSTRLSLARDGSLRSSSRPGPLEWQRRCEMLFGLVDLTALIEPRVLEAQREMARTIDERVAREDVRASMGTAWRALSSRIALDEGLGLWLRPSSLAIAEPSASEDAIETVVEIGVRPIVSAQAPSDAAPTPLPEPSVLASSPRAFVLHAEIEVPLSRVAAEIDALARPQLETFGAVLVSVRALGGEDAIWIGFELERPVPATLWLGAQVRFDPESRALSVSEVRASDETRRALEALGIDPRLVEGAFGSELSLPMADRIEGIERQLRTALAVPRRIGSAELRVDAREITLAGAFHTPSTIGLVLAVAGSADLVLGAP